MTYGNYEVYEEGHLLIVERNNYPKMIITFDYNKVSPEVRNVQLIDNCLPEEVTEVLKEIDVIVERNIT